jgi:Bacterial SH3 domain.
MKCGNKVENDLDDNRPGQNISTPSVQTKPDGNNNKLIVVLIVAVLIIGGIGGDFFFGRSSGEIKSVVQLQPNSTQQAQQATKPAENVPAQKEAPKEEKTGFIVGVNVNAREKASTDSTVVGTFALGEKVVVLTDEPEWVKVRRSDGKECYVFKKFLGDQAALDKRKAKYSIKSGPYPVFLNGDPNYILVDGHMGSAWYIIKSSVKREEISPNQWHIYCEIASATETGKISSGKPKGYTFFFDEKSRSAGVAHKGLRLFVYNGPRSETMVINGAGAMAYYIAMGKKWPEFGFSDDVYSHADL